MFIESNWITTVESWFENIYWYFSVHAIRGRKEQLWDTEKELKKKGLRVNKMADCSKDQEEWRNHVPRMRLDSLLNRVQISGEEISEELYKAEGAVCIVLGEMLLLMSMGWDWTAANNGPIVQSQHDTWVWRATVEWYWQYKTEKLEKNLPQCNTSTTNPTWTGMGANPWLRSRMPLANRLSHDTAFREDLIWIHNVQWRTRQK
jgi:hypothetical protein